VLLEQRPPPPAGCGGGVGVRADRGDQRGDDRAGFRAQPADPSGLADRGAVASLHRSRSIAMDSMAPVLRKLHSFTGPVESVFISRQSATVIVEAGDSLSTPHGTIGAVADVLAVRSTADGRHWIAALELEDGRHVVIVDGREVASYGRIHRSCAAISGDGARWAVFADTGRGERCLVIDGTVYGPFLDCPPGTGFNARPLVFDGQNALWCPVKTA